MHIWQNVHKVGEMSDMRVIFGNIFGFYNAEGLRLIRDVYLFVPRKFSKTTSVASLAIYDMLFGDSNAQAYVGANSYSQAKICLLSK